jgi:uncharacterized protein (TIRG00374 family)
MTAYIYFKTSRDGLYLSSLLGFFLMILTFFISIILLPVFARVQILRKLFSRIERLILSFLRHGFLNKILRKLFNETNSLFDAIALGSRKLSSLWKPIFYSINCLLFACLGMYFSGLAISGNVPFQAILAAISILSLASLLPMGLGGMGGMQIIAAIVFSIFEVSSQNAVSAQLLQTGVNLLAISLMGLLFARLSASQIRAILLSKQNEDLLTNKNT